MSTTLNKLRPFARDGKRMSLLGIIGLLLVPLTVAGALLWGLWSPNERLHTVTAAIVNLDEPVEVEGQLTPLGRVLAGELIGRGAPAGGAARESSMTRETDDGAVETVANFTWVLTDAEDAVAGLDDGRFAAAVTIPENFSAAATSFSRDAAEAESAGIEVVTSDRGRLLDAALSNIVVNTAAEVLNAQLGSAFIGSVFVGMTELGEGIGEAGDGATELAHGMGELADGAGSLADGVGELAGGATELSGGARQLADGSRSAAAGASQLADGIEAYTGGINQLLTGLQGQLPATGEGLQSLHALIANPETELPEGVDRAVLLGQIEAMIAGLGTVGGSLDETIAAGNNLAAGSRASANGQWQLVTSMDSFAQGLGEYAAGVPQLGDGVRELEGGAREIADGAGTLAEGLQTAAAEVPATTEAQRERLAESAVRPVEVRGASDELFTAAGVPLFVGLALWAGALASFLVLTPLWQRTREAARTIADISLRSVLPAVALGAGQGLLLGAALPPLLDYDAGQWIGFLALSVVAGMSFSLLVQGLAALFGGFGRFVSFVVLAVAFAAGVVSTAPQLMRAIGDASPVGALSHGFQALIMQLDGFGGSFGVLALWGLAGVALTAFAVTRARRAAPAH